MWSFIPTWLQGIASGIMYLIKTAVPIVELFAFLLWLKVRVSAFLFRFKAMVSASDSDSPDSDLSMVSA